MIYEVAAVVLEVHDGDTVHLKVSRDFAFPIDPWFGMEAALKYSWSHDVKCRLARINAPEIATPQGPPARNALAHLLALGSLRVVTGKRDKFDRPLVEIWVTPTTGPEFNVSDKMVAIGSAKLWDGRGEKPT
jgi:endonuclease YncB( thermonuclease family)